MGLPIIGDVIEEVGGVLRQVLPDPKARAEVELKLTEIRDRAEARAAEQLQGQVDVNKIEAAHASIFVAGWRPFVGWVCGFALAYTAILSPFIEFVARSIFAWKGEMPELPVSFLQVVLMGMLGLTAARTVETVTGTARSALGTQSEKVTTATAVVGTAAPPAAAAPRKKGGFRIKLPKIF